MASTTCLAAPDEDDVLGLLCTALDDPFSRSKGFPSCVLESAGATPGGGFVPSPSSSWVGMNMPNREVNSSLLSSWQSLVSATWSSWKLRRPLRCWTWSWCTRCSSAVGSSGCGRLVLYSCW